MSNVYGLSPVNTLANASYDVLRMDAIEDPLINVNKLATMDFEESYFAIAVDYIKESTREYTDSKIKLYKAISEATSEGVVLESFSDFFTSVKNIIDKFLKWIKSLFERFLNTLNSLISSDKYLNKHKKDLDNFRNVDEFTFTGYNYTFSETIPKASAALEFNSSLIGDDLKAAAGNALTVEDVKNTVNGLNLDEAYNTFRAEVLGYAGDSIDYSDFSEELFRVYRNDELDTEEIEVNSLYVRKAKARFFDYKKAKSSVERQQKAVNEAYRKVEKQVKELTSNNGNINIAAFMAKMPDSAGFNTIDVKHTTTPNTDNGILTAEFMTQMDIYLNAKIDMIQEYSNIHALAYSAKLDAMKDAYKQDKAVLYTALSKIMRTDNARKE
jgi:hypothetical protein